MSNPISYRLPNSGDCECAEEEMFCYDITIIGGGVAGLTAAIYAARDGFRVLVLEGELVSNVDMPGGALMLTPSIENFPGFTGSGEDLVASIRAQAEKFGADIVEKRAEHIHPSQVFGELHRVATSDVEYRTKAIIVTTGAIARTLNIHGEQEYWGRGVSTCATCDGWFFRDKTVVVIGGGDTAIEDAAVLARLAKKVYVMHRRPDFRAVGVELEELRERENVEMIMSALPQEVLGDESESHVGALAYIQHGEEKVLNVDGVFIAIGRDPATNVVAETGITLDEFGYIVTEPDSTRVLGGYSGIYAAGDAVDRVFRQAITSAGDAAKAALEARSYLLGRNLEPLKDVPTERLT